MPLQRTSKRLRAIGALNYFHQNERTNGTTSDAVAAVTKLEGMSERKP